MKFGESTPYITDRELNSGNRASWRGSAEREGGVVRKECGFAAECTQYMCLPIKH